MAFLGRYASKLEEANYKTAQGWVIDDQFALNLLLDEGMGKAVQVEGAPRVVYAANNTLRIHVLPVLLLPLRPPPASAG